MKGGGGDQIAPGPSSEKTNLKKPNLIRIKSIYFCARATFQKISFQSCFFFFTANFICLATLSDYQLLVNIINTGVSRP